MALIKRVYIEITNCCNLSCSFCPSTKRSLEFMDIDFFEEILEELIGVTRYVYLHIKGEPMLHPKLIEMILLCHQKGFKVNLTTNGTLIKQWSEQLLIVEGLRQVSISLQSFENGDQHDLLTYLSDVFSFAKEAILKGIYIELRLWNLESFQSKENLNKDILAYVKTFFELESNLKEQVIKDKGIRLKDYLYLSQSSEFEWPSLEHAFVSESGTCYGLKQQIGILVDGSIVPCCLDQEGDINLGKIGETKLIDVLNSPRVVAMKQGFERRILVEELCQKCGFRQRFS